jgi:hypothetical protein
MLEFKTPANEAVSREVSEFLALKRNKDLRAYGGQVNKAPAPTALPAAVPAMRSQASSSSMPASSVYGGGNNSAPAAAPSHTVTPGISANPTAHDRLRDLFNRGANSAAAQAASNAIANDYSGGRDGKPVATNNR